MAALRRASMLAMFLALCGCESPPPPVAVDALVFPVVRVTGTAKHGVLACRVDVFRTAEGLSHMRVEMYSEITDRTRADAPVVIDSTARAFDMEAIKGEHGSLWMMINPTGMMPISFSLVPRRQTGLAAARDLLAGCRFLGSGFDQDVRERRREAIRQAESMETVIEIVDGQHDNINPSKQSPRR